MCPSALHCTDLAHGRSPSPRGGPDPVTVVAGGEFAGASVEPGHGSAVVCALAHVFGAVPRVARHRPLQVDGVTEAALNDESPQPAVGIVAAVVRQELARIPDAQQHMEMQRTTPVPSLRRSARGSRLGTLCRMGSDEETPFARVPLGGPFETRSPYTVEGQIDQYGQLARGAARRPVLRWIVGAIVLAIIALMIYVPFSPPERSGGDAIRRRGWWVVAAGADAARAR